MNFNWQGGNNKKILIVAVAIALIGWYVIRQNDGGPIMPLYESEIGSAPMGVTSKQNPFTGSAGDQFAAPMARQEAMDSGASAIDRVMADDRKIVRTGFLELIVDKAEGAAGRIQSIALEAGGFVENLQIYELIEGEKRGSVTVRVPVERFGETMDKIKSLAINVSSETVNSQDVTEQYMDIEARLKNMRAEEEQYQEIMKSAVKIEDILNVTARLNDVRARIESLEGQLKLLKEEVEMSTITANLTAEGDIEVFGIHWQPWVVVKQSFRDMLESLTGYVDELIKLVFKLPALLLWLVTWVIIILAAWKVGRWAQRKWYKG